MAEIWLSLRFLSRFFFMFLLWFCSGSCLDFVQILAQTLAQGPTLLKDPPAPRTSNRAARINPYIFLKKSSPAKKFCLPKGLNLYIFSEKLLSAKISLVIFHEINGIFSSDGFSMKNV